MMICLEGVCSPNLLMSRGLHAILKCLAGKSSKLIKVLRVYSFAKVIEVLRVYSMSLFHDGISLMNGIAHGGC